MDITSSALSMTKTIYEMGREITKTVQISRSITKVYGFYRIVTDINEPTNLKFVSVELDSLDIDGGTCKVKLTIPKDISKLKNLLINGNQKIEESYRIQGKIKTGPPYNLDSLIEGKISFRPDNKNIKAIFSGIIYFEHEEKYQKLTLSGEIIVGIEPNIEIPLNVLKEAKSPEKEKIYLVLEVGYKIGESGKKSKHKFYKFQMGEVTNNLIFTNQMDEKSPLSLVLKSSIENFSSRNIGRYIPSGKSIFNCFSHSKVETIWDIKKDIIEVIVNQQALFEVIDQTKRDLSSREAIDNLLARFNSQKKMVEQIGDGKTAEEKLHANYLKSTLQNQIECLGPQKIFHENILVNYGKQIDTIKELTSDLYTSINEEINNNGKIIYEIIDQFKKSVTFYKVPIKLKKIQD